MTGRGGQRPPLLLGSCEHPEAPGLPAVTAAAAGMVDLGSETAVDDDVVRTTACQSGGLRPAAAGCTADDTVKATRTMGIASMLGLTILLARD